MQNLYIFGFKIGFALVLSEYVGAPHAPPSSRKSSRWKGQVVKYSSYIQISTLQKKQLDDRQYGDNI